MDTETNASIKRQPNGDRKANGVASGRRKGNQVGLRYYLLSCAQGSLLSFVNLVAEPDHSQELKLQLRKGEVY